MLNGRQGRCPKDARCCGDATAMSPHRAGGMAVRGGSRPVSRPFQAAEGFTPAWTRESSPAAHQGPEGPRPPVSSVPKDLRPATRECRALLGTPLLFADGLHLVEPPCQFVLEGGF